ncbi:MAG: hypothetical protein ABI664_05765 [bacterium]
MIPSARIIDVIIVLLVVELVALVTGRALRRRGMPIAELIAFLGAGLSMLIAVRIVAMGGPFPAFALAMLASLFLHLWHVRQRWMQ